MRYVIFLFIAIVGMRPFHAGAWGKNGHQMVAEIGYNLLDDDTREIIKKHLGNFTVDKAGTWMDDMRNNPKYAYMKPWHYINIEEGAKFQHNDDVNIVNELDATIEELRHPEHLSEVKIQQDILVLFHLIGDIAQPLHVGYNSDKGGNDIDVTYLGKPSNLHKVWDSEIIESEGITTTEVMDLYAGLTDERLDVLRSVNPLSWMNNSRRLLPRVYKFTDYQIDQAYISRNKTLLKKQILFAGVRLAATLEELFKVPVKFTGSMKSTKPVKRGLDTLTLEHAYYRSHFVNSAHIPWVVEYTLRASDVNCDSPLERSNKFAPDPYNKEATNIDKDYVKSGYDRGHNMPAADNGCHGAQAMTECFYFSNMFPQTHKLNAGVWKTLETQERDMASKHDSIYVWIGSYGIAKTIGVDKVVVPKYCWKVIYDYKMKEWSAYIFPNTLDVKGKPDEFKTTVADITSKSGYHFK
jgi:DNA/RNA endonuclease G (NUC1)